MRTPDQPNTNVAKALDPLEFRFTEPQDAGKYGDRWYLYDEAYWLRLRARDLMDLESEMDLTMVTVMNGVRARTTLGDTAAAWMSVYRVDPAVAGSFDEFNPVTNLIEWRPAEGKAEAVPEAAPADRDETAMPQEQDLPLPVAGHQPPTISGDPDLVVLQTTPAAE